MKYRAVHAVHLGPQAVDIAQRLKRISRGQGHLHPLLRQERDLIPVVEKQQANRGTLAAR